MRHVALMGKAQAGKDTVAQLLVRHAAYTRLAFADRLKESALRVDPVVGLSQEGPVRLADVVEADGWEYAKTFPEVRRYLQEYGQAVREMDPEFWLRPVVDQMEQVFRRNMPCVVDQMEQGFRLNMPCVVTDVRYRNEVDAMRAMGALIVRVERPGAGLAGGAEAHVSETELDGVEPDVVLNNAGTLDDLYRAVRDLYSAELTNGE